MIQSTFNVSCRLGNCEEELPKKPVGRLSVNCQQTADSRPTDGRQSADSRPTVGRQSADSRLTGFLGSSSSQLPTSVWEKNSLQALSRWYQPRCKTEKESKAICAILCDGHLDKRVFGVIITFRQQNPMGRYAPITSSSWLG